MSPVGGTVAVADLTNSEGNGSASGPADMPNGSTDGGPNGGSGGAPGAGSGGRSAGGSSGASSTPLIYAELQPSDVEDVVAFMAEHFYPREPLSTGLHMTYEDNQEWIHNSVAHWLRSGTSVVARNPEDGSIAGTSLATVLTRNRNTSFDEALDSPREKVKTLHTVLSVLEASVDFFAKSSVQKILELAMITVSAEYSGRGVGRCLVQESERRGRALGCEVATAQATAVASQRLFQRIGYQSLYELDYASFRIAGQPVFDMTNMMGTGSAKVMAKMLVGDTPLEEIVSRGPKSVPVDCQVDASGHSAGKQDG